MRGGRVGWGWGGVGWGMVQSNHREAIELYQLKVDIGMLNITKIYWADVLSVNLSSDLHIISSVKNSFVPEIPLHCNYLPCHYGSKLYIIFMSSSYTQMSDPQETNNTLEVNPLILQSISYILQITPIKMIERSVYSGYYCFEHNLCKRWVKRQGL